MMSDVCSVCAGTGKPVSGLPCICGGEGTAYAELQGFRVLTFKQDEEILQLKDKLKHQCTECPLNR